MDNFRFAPIILLLAMAIYAAFAYLRSKTEAQSEDGSELVATDKRISEIEQRELGNE